MVPSSAALAASAALAGPGTATSSRKIVTKLAVAEKVNRFNAFVLRYAR